MTRRLLAVVAQIPLVLAIMGLLAFVAGIGAAYLSNRGDPLNDLPGRFTGLAWGGLTVAATMFLLWFVSVGLLLGILGGGGSILTVPALVYAAGLVPGWLLERRWPSPYGLIEPLAQWIGWSLIAVGVVVLVWALIALRRVRTSVNPYTPSTAIATTGPYRWSRNPIYVADLVIYLGVCALLNSLWPLLFLPAVIAQRVAMELANLHPRPPAVRVFDAGMGDATVLTRVMREMHRRFPSAPFYIVGKEISLEDVRLALEKMPDRFFEHPATVLVMTNLYYREAPWLVPGSLTAASGLAWHELALTGTSGHEFEEQITALAPFLAEHWRAHVSPASGNPVYERPAVLVVYREDHRFMLDSVLPQPRIGLVHVADDDGDVLEPAVVGAHVRGNRAAARDEVLRELDEFIAQPHANNTHAQAEHALQMLVSVAVHFDVRHFLEAQHAREEFRRAVHVGNGEARGIHGGDQRRLRQSDASQ